MKRRGNANTWLLGILIAILGVIGIDIGHRMYSPSKVDTPEQIAKKMSPPFKVGDVAPDFSLPDDERQYKSLSQLIKGDTILTFTCGCSACKEMHTYLAELLKKMGERAPHVVTVTSMPADGEAAWIRDTKLKQAFLFQPHDGPEFARMQHELKGKGVENYIDLYKGHPCPRVYRVDGDRRITWIGPSSATAVNPVTGSAEMASAVAQELGFAPLGAKVPGKPSAPPFQGTDLSQVAAHSSAATPGANAPKQGSATPH
jgi:hypothetical protein